MARMSKEARLTAVHEDAMREFNEIQTAQRDERIQCKSDRRFCSISGAQWEGGLGDQFANKPRFEFNKTHLAVIRVINEYRNNRITVDFQPKDGATDDQMADTCDGLYRADERSCTADEAYDNAFDEGVQGGFGAWRLRACYEDEDDDENEKQRVKIEPIFDADSSVFFDLNAKRQDKADAKSCYVLTQYSRRAYMEEWEDDPASWPNPIDLSMFDWCTAEVVWVCELYKVEERSETVHFFRGLDEEAEDMRVTATELEEDEKKLDELTAMGFREVRRKKIRERVVHKYILSGGKVLEDCGIIPGKCIPIVPFFGKRWVVDGIERCMGHVRLAKDAQRLTNMLMSWLATMAARFDMEKPILTPEQVAGHSLMWANDNVEQYPYLLINPITDANGTMAASGPVGYTKVPNIPPAMAALAQLAQQALTELLGNQQAGEQLQANLSGKAVELIQNRLDMQVFIYMSNLAKSMKRSGEIWLSMMKDIVVEKGRRMKTVSGNGEASSVLVNQPMYDEEEGKEYLDNDLTKANFEVDVDVGPSSDSRRAATVRALTGMMQVTQDPETLQVLSSLALMNMEGEGLSDARDYFRNKMVRMGVIKPNEEEQAQMEAEAANRKPDPQAQYLIAAAEQAQADAQNKRADTIESIASAELKKAQTAKTYAEAMGARQDQEIASAEVLGRLLNSGGELPPPPAPVGF